MVREIIYQNNSIVNKFNAYFFEKVADLFAGITIISYLWSVERQKNIINKLNI